jgi:hypothetical protein
VFISFPLSELSELFWRNLAWKNEGLFDKIVLAYYADVAARMLEIEIMFEDTLGRKLFY